MDVGGEELETVIGEMVAVLENGMVTFVRGRILSRLADSRNITPLRQTRVVWPLPLQWRQRPEESKRRCTALALMLRNLALEERLEVELPCLLLLSLLVTRIQWSETGAGLGRRLSNDITGQHRSGGVTGGMQVATTSAQVTEHSDAEETG